MYLKTVYLKKNLPLVKLLLGLLQKKVIQFISHFFKLKLSNFLFFYQVNHISEGGLIDPKNLKGLKDVKLVKSYGTNSSMFLTSKNKQKNESCNELKSN